MQPFTSHTLYALILGTACYLVCYFLFRDFHGLAWIMLRSAAFCALYGGGVIALKLSPDVLPIWETVKKRIGITGNKQ